MSDFHMIDCISIPIQAFAINIRYDSNPNQDKENNIKKLFENVEIDKLISHLKAVNAYISKKNEGRHAKQNYIDVIFN